MSDFTSELTDSVDIYRKPDETMDGMGNPVISGDGNFEPVETSVFVLILPVTEKKAADLQELGFKDVTDPYIMYAENDCVAKINDYIKDGDDWYFVFHKTKKIPKNHHKEYFIKSVDGIELNDGGGS